MINSILVIEVGPTPGIWKREHNRLMRESFEQAGAFYHVQFMHKHFTRAGAKEYGYKPRAGEQAGIGSRRFFRSYSGRKLREKGHQRPLVWSGASETLARIRDVRANSRRGRIVQHARGLNRKNPNSEIDMAREVRTVSRSEALQTVERFGRHYREQAAKLPKRKTRRIS